MHIKEMIHLFVKYSNFPGLKDMEIFTLSLKACE